MTRYLTIGVENTPPQIDADVDWDEEYNIKDFDVVFADLQKLTENSSSYTPPGRGEDSVVFPPNDHIETLLFSGGDIYVILPETREVRFKYSTLRKTHTETIDLLDWLPNIEYHEESGSTIEEETVDSDWAWFFNSNFEWPAHFGRIEEESPFTDYAPIDSRGPPFAFGHSLAMNRVRETISVEVKLTYSDIDETPRDFSPGSIYLIPAGSYPSSGKVVYDIIENLIEDDGPIEEIPIWIENYTLPEERELLEQIHEKRKSLEKLEAKLEGEERYKELLYERGSTLEEAVRKSLETIGLNVKGETPHGSDATIEIEDVRFLVEIYGTKNGISIDKASQLDDWVDEELLSNPEKEISGLLVANPFCEDDPTEREIDPNNVIEYLDARGYKLMTTIDLFKAVRAHQVGNLSPSEFSGHLVGDSTVIRFPEIPIQGEI